MNLKLSNAVLTSSKVVRVCLADKKTELLTDCFCVKLFKLITAKFWAVISIYLLQNNIIISVCSLTFNHVIYIMHILLLDIIGWYFTKIQRNALWQRAYTQNLSHFIFSQMQFDLLISTESFDIFLCFTLPPMQHEVSRINHSTLLVLTMDSVEGNGCRSLGRGSLGIRSSGFIRAYIQQWKSTTVKLDIKFSTNYNGLDRVQVLWDKWSISILIFYFQVW